MQELLSAVIGYAVVGALWGCTNPFLKNAQGNTQAGPKQDTKESPILGPLWRLITNPRMLVPYVANQSGSLVYYYLLSNEPVSRASPICNALTFLFTAVTGYAFFGEEVRNPVMLCVGIAFVLVGVVITVS